MSGLNCFGGHHHEDAKNSVCFRCGKSVVKLVNKAGKIYTVDSFIRVPESGRAYDTFACWGGFHSCDEELVELKKREDEIAREVVEHQLAEGAIVKNQTVVVVSNRSKISFGTVATIKWVGADDFGNERVGLSIEGEEKLQYASSSVVVALPSGADALEFANKFVAEQKAERKAAKKLSKELANAGVEFTI